MSIYEIAVLIKMLYPPPVKNHFFAEITTMEKICPNPDLSYSQ